jgi:replicative DNA helicase
MSEFVQELLLRKAMALRAIPFCIEYLNDALNGIRPCDLVVVIARTGVGKTELLAAQALEAAKLGKQVFFYALEAEKYEIQRRIAYRIFSQRFFENRRDYPAHIWLNYTDWLFDKYPELDELNQQVAEEMPRVTEGIEFYTPDVTEFTRNDFTNVYKEIVNDADLIILDHIHYIAREDKVNEYDHIQRVVCHLRELINKHSVPLVAVSHIRKEDKRNSSLLPTLEEIHGASEISKQANHVVSLAPCYQVPSKHDETKVVEPQQGSTLCRIIKTRSGHAGAERYAALLKFNPDTKTYEDSYVPYRTDKFATEIESVGIEDFERWMSHAREPLL